MRKHLLRTCAIALAFSLTLSLASCGTLLYPERRGQTGGHIDPAVAILDGIGLIVFLVPGLFAFAIDFATGAVYLPGGKRAALPPGKPTLKEMEDYLSTQLDYPFSFEEAGLQAYVIQPAHSTSASTLE